MDSADGHNGRKQQSQCSLLKLLTCLAVSQGDEREVEKLRGQPTSEVIELWRQLLANTCAQYKSWQRAIDNSSSAAGFKPLHQHIQQQAQEAAQQVGRTASVYDEAVLWGEWWDSCDPDDFCDLSGGYCLAGTVAHGADCEAASLADCSVAAALLNVCLLCWCCCSLLACVLPAAWSLLCLIQLPTA